VSDFGYFVAMAKLESSGQGWNLADWGAVAAFVALIGLIPVLYNAVLQLNDRRKSRHARIIRTARSNTWHLIRPNYDQKMTRVEDVMACQEVFAKLTGMGLRVTVGGDDQDHPKDSNLVLVCGPKGNAASARLQHEVELPFETINNEGAWVFRDKRTFQLYKSPLDSGHQADIAIFGRVSDQAGNSCYLLWGAHGSGTVGAARAFANDRFLEETWKLVKDRDFVGIIYFGFTSLDDIKVVRWLANPVQV
jgi:hypothetical protein